jgi:hypothetical protein
VDATGDDDETYDSFNILRRQVTAHHDFINPPYFIILWY